jgi:hypothetical protein
MGKMKAVPKDENNEISYIFNKIFWERCKFHGDMFRGRQASK